MSFGRRWTPPSHGSRTIRSLTLSATEEPVAPSYDGFPMSSGTACLRTSWLFWRAFTADASHVRFALAFAAAAIDSCVSNES